MIVEQPEDARARRMAAIRALRGTPDRLQRIADLEQQKVRSKKPSTSGKGGRKTPENSSHMFNHPWSVWFEMRDAANAYLCQCATERRTTSYAELWGVISSAIGEDLGDHWRQLPILLGFVSKKSFTEMELISSALIVYKDGDAEPGPGFFRIAADLGALPESDVPPKGVVTPITENQRQFWEASVAGMYERFATTPA